MRSDAQESRTKLVRATRDVVAEAGTTEVSLRAIATSAGVSMATLYRHFDSRHALVDEVSIRRWSRLRDVAHARGQEEPALLHVARTLDTYSRMTSEDHRFILGARILELGKRPVEHIRADFEPAFAESWVAAQVAGLIHPTADPRDAVDMTGAIRDSRRRLPMLAMLLGGVCTERVDIPRLLAQVTAARPSETNRASGSHFSPVPLSA